ncbi:hypothetical protein EKO04_001678 [Ascochyta lentis]|uniref:Uncharacterized protein n=1 Tax=Ascochyta lentis TaxID=205686 RepID=A0A8H7JCX9_9PLEO|nr:hypothetical protein EKO04_001678 [Ascochyta lentis]
MITEMRSKIVEEVRSSAKSLSMTVLKFTKTAKFTGAYDLVLLMDNFIHLHGDFRSDFYICAGCNVSKYLVGIGTNKCGDEKLYTSTVELSRTVLQGAPTGLDEVGIELHELQHLVTDLIATLSQNKRYKDPKRVLQLLWNTKTIRNNLSLSPLVLDIGRSIVQILAALGKYSDAIHLCYHIGYNLEFIRGALDCRTLEFTILLSSLYAVQQRYHGAFDFDCTKTFSPISARTNPHQRHGKFDKDVQQYEGLFCALDVQFGNDKKWKKNRPQLNKWMPGVPEEELFGCWKRPERFE